MGISRAGYSGDLPPAAFNMARYCLRAGNAAASKPALIVVHDAVGGATETLTYRGLEQAVRRAAYAFRSTYKLERGSRLAIRLKNCTSYAIAFFGAAGAGLVPIPISPELTARELDFLLSDSEAAAILLDDGLPHGSLEGLTIIPQGAFDRAIGDGPAADFEETAACDPAFLIYTSGTTAAPKGVLHAHRSAWGRRPMYQGWYGITPADRLLHAGSFNWTYTLGTGLCDPWANGATAIVYTGEKNPAIWPRLMKEHEVSIFAAVPGVYRQMMKYGDLRQPGDFPRLRHGLIAGEMLPAAVLAEWQARSGTPLYEALGQSELSTYVSSSPSTPPKPEKIGRPQPGRCVAIMPEEGLAQPLEAGTEGLIAVHRSDPGLMIGYWRRPAEEAEMFRGDWFFGGDAGVMDEDGYIAHLGRHNELINAGGFRVSPAEVEQELAKHPSVSEAAVAEVPIRDGVSIIAAFVVAREGANTELAADLASLASRTLASYKRPKKYVFVPALPRTPNGKLRRGQLKGLMMASS
ncbi:MAG: class I adenylate-forming enzyme family protein [Rhodomicrobium sp.]